MFTMSDIVLPDSPVDYSSYLLEMDSCITLPLFSYNFEEKRAEAEHDLKNLVAVREESSLRALEARRESESLSIACTERLKELEAITTSIKKLECQIKEIEKGRNREELDSLETAKTTLNMYKRLIKLKWFHSSTDNLLECVIFNDKNAYLKYVEFDKTDPLIVEKVWSEISQAIGSSWKDLLARDAPIGTL